MTGDDQSPTPTALGWDDDRQRELDELGDPELRPARVASAARGQCLLLGLGAPLPATLRGALAEAPPLERPAVGDWVAARPDGAGQAVVERVLDRRARFARKSAGRSSAAQVVAANVDRVFAVTAVGGDFNPRRIERYLTAIWDGGSEPVVVVNKTDLPHDPAALIAELGRVAMGVTTVLTSARDGEGLDEVVALCEPGRTVALVGSSGVGKSTLTNRLLGRERQATGAVRESDDRGRHVTSARELLVAPGGAVLVDTPGMREIGLWDADDGLDQTFADIAELAAGCRFRDCAHESEAGCAVLAAVERGEIDPARLDSYHRLQREIAHNARRAADGVKENSKKRWKQVGQWIRQREELHRKRGLK